MGSLGFTPIGEGDDIIKLQHRIPVWYDPYIFPFLALKPSQKHSYRQTWILHHLLANVHCYGWFYKTGSLHVITGMLYLIVRIARGIPLGVFARIEVQFLPPANIVCPSQSSLAYGSTSGIELPLSFVLIRWAK